LEPLTEWTLEEAERGSIAEGLAMQVLARRLPKAELHTHFLGSIRNSFPYTADAWAAVAKDYVNSAGFFSGLRTMAAALTSVGVYEAATLHVLQEAVRCGCRHVEMFATPGELRCSPVPVADALKAMGRAFDEMKRYTGVTGGLILATDRADDPAAGMVVVTQAMAARDAGVPVLGIGNDGDFVHPVRLFAPALEYAKKEGFHTTCHLCTPQDVVEGLDLPLDRADHAYDLKGNPELIAKYRQAGIGVTSCISCLCMMGPGLFPTPADHPVNAFRQAGLQTCLGTDDAAFFYTDLSQEYVLAQQAFNWTRQDMLDMAMASLEMAWIDGPDRDRQLAAWRAEGERSLSDPRTSKPSA
jgi:adenosine deaminase